MDQKEINRQILGRLKRLESEVFGNKNSITRIFRAKKIFKGVTGGIKLLITQGLFKKKRTFIEIKEALNKKSYFSSLQAIQTALDRLSTSKGPLVKLKQGKKNYYAERK